MRRPDEGNPRAGYVGIHAMIPDTRVRQPRDGPMKCGNQSADISMIHRRYSCRRVALLVRCPIASMFAVRSWHFARRALCHLTGSGHISLHYA